VQLAFEAHDGQKRRSGEPFIIHPVEVARILGELVSHSKLKKKKKKKKKDSFRMVFFLQSAIKIDSNCSSRNWIGSLLLLDYYMTQLRIQMSLLLKE
jgi:hypothetical protein